MKKLKNKFRLFFISILIFFYPSHSLPNLNLQNLYLFKYSTNEKIIKISENNLKRLKEFFFGDFYSYEQNNYQSGAKGIYFAVSESGNSSVFSFCNEDINNCILNNMQFITKKKCERISKEKCTIIATNNKIILNKKIYSIKNENLEKLFTTLFKIHPDTSAQIKGDIRVNLFRDFEKSTDYE